MYRLYGTQINCAPGFQLLRNGVSLFWYDTKEYPEPAFPFGADLLGGAYQIINYTDGGSGGDGTPGDLSNYYTKPESAALFGVGAPDAVIRFSRHWEYATINTSTTIDVTGAKVGAVVRVKLGPDAPSSPMPASGFQRLTERVHEAGKRHVYSFCVSADGTIDYYILAY